MNQDKYFAEMAMRLLPGNESEKPVDRYEAAARTYAKQCEVHEADFAVFKFLDGLDGLFLDVGANIGQSALSFFCVNHSMRVLSLEPNFHLRRALEFIQSLYPRRFDFMLAGATDRLGVGRLLLPKACNLDLSVNGSLNPTEFQKDYVKARIDQVVQAVDKEARIDFEQFDVELITIDTLNIRPLVVKIDIEGLEYQALLGARETIQASHPILLIENNDFNSYARLLMTWGYRLFRFSSVDGKLVRITWKTTDWALNHFWIHPETSADTLRRLGPLLNTNFT